MAENRGKNFEQVIRSCFEKVPGVSIDRLHDQMNGFAGSQNICDFIVYREPHEYYFECKSVHGNRLPLSNITDTQWRGLSEKSKIKGVFAGIICWWIDRDVTKFVPIEALNIEKYVGAKSIRYDSKEYSSIEIPGRKKRVFFDYDMEAFLNTIERS